jgi:hypothetical protein
MCNAHRHWSFKHGGAIPTHPIRPVMNPAETLRLKTEQDPQTGCVLWTGHTDHRGYGRLIDVTTGQRRAHRVAWVIERGPIPAGLTIDHLCRTKNCVNVGHMEVVTSGENTRRAAPYKTRHCPSCTCMRDA